MKKEQKQIHSLTGLKAVLILFIVLTHTLPDTPLVRSIPLTSILYTYTGVWSNSLFFMLSGYLLSMGYRERITTRELPFGTYLRRRLSKLYPMYILSNLAILPLYMRKYGPTVLNLKRVANIALLQAGGALENEFPFNGSTWFVCALFTCYILYYFLAYHSRNKTKYRSFLVMCVIAGYFLSARHLDIPYCYNESGAAYLNFFTGCILNEIIPEIPEKHHKKISAIILGALCYIGFMMLRYGIDVMAGQGAIGYSFVLFPMILVLSSIPNFVSKILGTKPFVYFGKISVSVYFWHGVLEELFLLITGTAAFTEGVFCLYMVLLFPVCITIYQLFRWKKLV